MTAQFAGQTLLAALISVGTFSTGTVIGLSIIGAGAIAWTYSSFVEPAVNDYLFELDGGVDLAITDASGNVLGGMFTPMAYRPRYQMQ